MRKVYLKLIAISLTLFLSVSVVAMSSYAWLVLSGNPAVSGIQVVIGGGNTILIAPDVTEEVDGVTYHYPGTFTDTMNFSRYTSYSYLNDVAGLTPVSTSDGITWFIPQYYDYSDEEVRQGEVLSGTLKDFNEFYQDIELEYANLPAESKELIAEGSYIYLDFWVVSPGDDFTLRLSTGTDTGSFVVDLMQPESNETAEGLSKYALTDADHIGSASIRLGFLANPYQLTDESMLRYQNSPYVDKRYTSLRGLYAEPNTGNAHLEENRFTIYEPNADVHPYGNAVDGSYVRTMPIGLVDGVAQPVTAYDRTTVQSASRWLTLTGSATSEIEQRFQAAILMKDTENMSAEEISDFFYGEYLQWQISPYVTKGQFIKNAASLAGYGSELSVAEYEAQDKAGATEDVYIIKLERNVPQRIRMFIWIEGQDVDCVNAAAASNFAINLELAGGNDEEK